MTQGDNRLAVVIDIDNTLLDTAIRKEALLRSKFGVNTTVDAIRKDFHLENTLGRDSEIAKRFFETLDSVDAYQYPAPPFPGAVDTLCLLRQRGIHIVILSGRHQSLKDTTMSELDIHGLQADGDDLFLLNPEFATSSTNSRIATLEFKKQKLVELAGKYRIIAAIGDRAEDAEAAKYANVPAIIFTSTLGADEITRLRNSSSSGLEVCESWAAITIAFDEIRLGRLQMERLRETFTAQYASWLRDIDEKIKSIISVSAIISAISGQRAMTAEKIDFGVVALLLALVFSILSILFCLRGITSRQTSGTSASIAIPSRLRQMIAILFGRPKHWLHLEGDAIDSYLKFKRLNPQEQAAGHLNFFYSLYHTFNPEALLNLRMLELRSSNYAKAYAERIASNLLTFSIGFLFIWLIHHIAVFTVG
jgi:phosphoglycolate phosphatase-like HAD superfamily hydrolase